jgi:hypothetical protein
MPTIITACEICGTNMPSHYVCNCGHRFRYHSEGIQKGDNTKTIKIEGDDGKLYDIPLPVARKIIHASTLALEIVRYLDDGVLPSTFASPESEVTG